jgi:hypothetical protein
MDKADFQEAGGVLRGDKSGERKEIRQTSQEMTGSTNTGRWPVIIPDLPYRRFAGSAGLRYACKAS